MQLNTGRYLEAYALMTLVFCGTVQYFTGIAAVLWLPFFLVLVMAVLLLMQSRPQPLALTGREKLILALYLTFILLGLVSTVLQSGVVTAIVGFKNELALSLLMFCMLLGMFSESQLYRLTRLFYWIYYVQIPVAIYQVISWCLNGWRFAVKMRSGTPWSALSAATRWAAATPRRWGCSVC